MLLPCYRHVSVLFNEPKLLKFTTVQSSGSAALVSVLFNEPKLLKFLTIDYITSIPPAVSVLFNEPKLLKSALGCCDSPASSRFSALQRAEIAEIELTPEVIARLVRVSVLFNEPKLLKFG